MRDPSRRETTIGRATDQAQHAACRAFAVQFRAGRRPLGRVERVWSGQATTFSPSTSCSPSSDACLPRSMFVASPTEHADLFWAVRGSGANLGVVTSFEYRRQRGGPRARRRCGVAARPGQAGVAVRRRARTQAPRWPGWAGCERAVTRLTTHTTQGRQTIAEGPDGAVEARTALGRWRDRGSEIPEVSVVTRLRCRMFVCAALAVGVPCSPRWRCPSASRVAQDRDRVLGDADIPP